MPDVNGFLTPEERQANAQERLVRLAELKFFGLDAFRAAVRDAKARGRSTTDAIAAGLDKALYARDEMDHFKITPALLLRLMEFGREDAKRDVSLHELVDNMNELQSRNPGKVLDSHDYDAFVRNSE